MLMEDLVDLGLTLTAALESHLVQSQSHARVVEEEVGNAAEAVTEVLSVLVLKKDQQLGQSLNQETRAFRVVRVALEIEVRVTDQKDSLVLNYT